MRLLIGSLAVLLVSAFGWFQERGLQLPERLSDSVAMRDLFFVVAAVYLCLESAWLLSRKSTAGQVVQDFSEAKLKMQSRISELQQNQLDAEAKAQKALLEKDRLYQERINETSDLRLALTEARERIQNLTTAKDSHDAGNMAVVSFLALLQQKGRFIDFIMDDIAQYEDAQVGAAARVVHQGCSQLVHEHFSILPVHSGQEGERIELPQGFNVEKYRLLGRVVGDPPFRGVVLHRGWKADRINLPKASPGSSGVDAREVISPAEVELN